MSLSLWSKISQLPETAKQSVYDKFKENFPAQIQNFVLFTIEDSAWSLFNTNDPGYLAQFGHFINGVQAKLTREDNFKTFIENLKIRESINYVQDTFAILIEKVQEFLNFVQDKVDEHKMVCDQQQFGQQSGMQELSQTIDYLDIQTNVIEQLINEFRTNQDHYQAIQKVTKEYKILIQMLHTTPDQLSKVIMAWRTGHRLSKIGYKFENYLDQVQCHFEHVVQVMLDNRARLDGLLAHYQLDQSLVINELRGLAQTMNEMLVNLVTRSLVIEDQPSIVNMKANYVRNLICRFLFGQKLASYYLMADIQVKIVKEEKGKFITVGTDTNCKNELIMFVGNFSLNASTKIILNEVRFDEFNRVQSGDGVRELVAEQMHYLVLECQLILNGRPIHIKQYSDPISVVSHSKQEPAAHGAIIWSYMGWPTWQGDKEGSASMSEVIKVVNDMFLNRLERGLSDCNKTFIASKILCKSRLGSDWLKAKVSRTMFIRVNTNKLTFWDWLYHALKLTADQLKDVWNAGLIVGFISREETKNILANEKMCPSGTFILRFSESERGGICVSYYDHDESSLQFLAPFKAADIEKGRTLADLLRNCRIKELPDQDIFASIYTSDSTIKAKHDALQTFYTKLNKQDKKNEYVDALVQIIINKNKK